MLNKEGAERISLVPLAAEHLDATRKWANDPYLMQRILRVTAVSEQDQQRWFERLQDDPSRVVFAVLFREEHVGNVGLYDIDTLHGRAMFWIMLGEAGARGVGLGSEAIRLMLAYGFHELGLHKIYLHVGVDNVPALRIYDKMGFVQEGILRQHFLINGHYVDAMMMSLLRSEYVPEK